MAYAGDRVAALAAGVIRVAAKPVKVLVVAPAWMAYASDRVAAPAVGVIQAAAQPDHTIHGHGCNP